MLPTLCHFDGQQPYPAGDWLRKADENKVAEQSSHSPEGVPIDVVAPNVTRVWNYLAGGKDNFEADRNAAKRLEAVAPMIAHTAPASGAFLRRVVRYLAKDLGIRQFIDIGPGIPLTGSNTHEVAQAIAPESRIVYVDDDPLVLAHARALLASTPEGAANYIHADMRDPGSIVAAVRKILDFSKPIAIVTVNFLKFISDTGDVRSFLAAFLTAVPAGSYLAIVQLAGDIDPTLRAAEQRWTEVTGAPVALRSREDMARLVDGLQLVEPGVVTVSEWRPDENDAAHVDMVPLYGAVASKPQGIRHRYFVSAPAGTDLRPLLGGLEERGVTPYILSDVASLGASLLQSLQEAIVAADRVVIVLEAAGQSLNSAFEAGMAAALGKPVVIIAPPSVALPSDLAGFLTVRARADELDSIHFALDQAEGRVPPSNPSAPISGSALGAHVDELLARSDRIVSLKDTAAIEQAAIDLLAEAIEGSGALAVQADAVDGGFDLGVWSDDLDSIAANPLLIEVKRTLDPASVRQATAALQTNPSAHTALIVVLDPARPDPTALGAARFPVLAISLRDLLERMRTASFAEIMRQLRNQNVHGVPTR